MRLPVQIRFKAVTMEELSASFHRGEVLDYCMHCHHYGKNFTCPSHDFDEETLCKAYSYALLILTKISSAPLKGRVDGLSPSRFPSRVYDQYLNDGEPKEPDVLIALGMSAYNQVKDEISERLMELERLAVGSLGLPPGACTGCAVCQKEVARPCPHPERIRYSLESLGFKVSEILEHFFDQKLEWTAGELPEAFYTCSALLLKDNSFIEELQQSFGSFWVNLDIEDL